MNKKLILLILIFVFVTSVAADDLFDKAILAKKDTGFLGSMEGKLSILFPMILLIICVVSYMIDFGTTGVILGALGTLVASYLVGFIAINPVNLVAFVIMGGILIFSLRN